MLARWAVSTPCQVLDLLASGLELQALRSDFRFGFGDNSHPKEKKKKRSVGAFIFADFCLGGRFSFAKTNPHMYFLANVHCKFSIQTAVLTSPDKKKKKKILLNSNMFFIRLLWMICQDRGNRWPAAIWLQMQCFTRKYRFWINTCTDAQVFPCLKWLTKITVRSVFTSGEIVWRQKPTVQN